METDSFTSRAEKIRELFLNASAPLIIASRPLDFDCLGSSLALKWWFNQHQTKANIVTFNKKNDVAKQFPKVDQIKFIYPNQYQYDQYDLFVLIDGGDWHQFFTKDFDQVLESFDKDLMVHIDHHKEGSISKVIGERSLRKDECCTAKMIYDFFIQPTGLELTPLVATWLYMALVTDTGNFKHLLYSDTFSFGQTLFNAGADHNKAIDITLSKESIDFTKWALSNTDYHDQEQTTILMIDEKRLNFLDNKFGRARLENNYANYYKASFMRLADGYPYAMIFEYSYDGSIKVSWRTRTGSPVAIQEVLNELDIQAGGHRNAGGGLIHDRQIKEVVSDFLKKMNEKVMRKQR